MGDDAEITTMKEELAKLKAALEEIQSTNGAEKAQLKQDHNEVVGKLGEEMKAMEDQHREELKKQSEEWRQHVQSSRENAMDELREEMADVRAREITAKTVELESALATKNTELDRLKKE